MKVKKRSMQKPLPLDQMSERIKSVES
jgi:hypothetical protein